METNTTTEITQAEFVCPDCPERGPFKNKLALAMHINRVHTKKIKVPMQGIDPKEKKRLLKRRNYQKVLRERYKKEGKDSRGYPLKGKKKPAFGAPWTPERRAKFERTWRSKNRSKIKEIKQDMNSHDPPPLEDPRGFFNNCPHCGGELGAFYYAAGALKRHGK